MDDMPTTYAIVGERTLARFDNGRMTMIGDLDDEDMKTIATACEHTLEDFKGKWFENDEGPHHLCEKCFHKWVQEIMIPKNTQPLKTSTPKRASKKH